jgi:hypothetical protein
MDRVLGAIKAAYYFFAGDAIVLAGVVLAFVAAYLLETLVRPPNQLVAGGVFVVLILLSITVTLGRERASARAKQQAERHA